MRNRRCNKFVERTSVRQLLEMGVVGFAVHFGEALPMKVVVFLNVWV